MKTTLKTFPQCQPNHNVRNFALALKWKEDFEAELREELKKWDKDVKANIMSAWAPLWIRQELLGDAE